MSTPSNKGVAPSALETNLLIKQLDGVFGCAPPEERDLPADAPVTVPQDLDMGSRLSPQEAAQLSYGFVAGPGRYETTLTRPDLYGDYYLEQFGLLLRNQRRQNHPLRAGPARLIKPPVFRAKKSKRSAHRSRLLRNCLK